MILSCAAISVLIGLIIGLITGVVSVNDETPTTTPPAQYLSPEPLPVTEANQRADINVHVNVHMDGNETNVSPFIE